MLGTVWRHRFRAVAVRRYRDWRSRLFISFPDSDGCDDEYRRAVGVLLGVRQHRRRSHWVAAIRFFFPPLPANLSARTMSRIGQRADHLRVRRSGLCPPLLVSPELWRDQGRYVDQNGVCSELSSRTRLPVDLLLILHLLARSGARSACGKIEAQQTTDGCCAGDLKSWIGRVVVIVPARTPAAADDGSPLSIM